MLWRLVSYNGFSLKSDTYFTLLKAGDNPFILPTVTSQVISGGDKPAMIGGVKRELDILLATVVIEGPAKDAALRALVSVLDNEDETLHPLIIEEDVNGTQWSLDAKVLNIARDKGWSFKIFFEVPDKIWRKAATPVVWNVTSSPSSQALVNAGNRNTFPVIKFKATAIKADGFLYRAWVPIVNPNDERAFANYALDLTDGGVDTRPWVKDTSNTVKINDVAGITNAQTTIPYDTLTGTVETYGMGWLDDGVNVEQISWTGRTGTTSGNLTGVTRAIGGTTAHAFADNVVIYLSYMQANGNDLRFERNGAEQDIWVTNPNTASTRIFANVSEKAGVTGLTLLTAIPGAGAVGEIEFKVTFANRTALASLPPSGVVRIGDEAFHYTDRDPIRVKMDIDQRAINDTAEAAHAIGASVDWVQNDCWLYSGNPFLEAQDTNDRRKPILAMATSDNTTRDYTEFYSRSQPGRSARWTPKVEQSLYPQDEASLYYPGDHMDETADPATEMGMMMQSIYKSGLWRAENGFIVGGSIYDPAGIYRVVSWTHEKYRSGPSYPRRVGLQKSKDGLLWENVAPIAPPTAAGSWGTPTTAGPYVMGTGYYYLRVAMWGTQNPGQSANVGYVSAFEINSFKYETVLPLDVQIRARSSNSYEFNAVFRNTANGTFFRLKTTLKINDEIELDCNTKTTRLISNNLPRRSAIVVPNTQANWMYFKPGSNPLWYTEAGVMGVTITISYDELLAV